MAKLNRVVLAGIGIAGVSFLSSKNNREKARVMLNNVKTKADSWMKKKKHNKSPMTKIGHSDPHDIADNKMVSEGAMYSVDYYNMVEQEE
ncbi:hypothetical protein B5V89_15615 [Heyndrickxia sporothermodurans]|uniref:hypothetical protein n=1 Tax=Heyndrickxia sporothermodurans TaxID=46224 RepID=UPI000D3CB1CF|nr:hypothetical protein [Heyndrickxia sporothermodurans]PTY77087.1 hypothetical protein B5V89_15615 [Heyndrickxia sporothermodurans]